ncbi:endonuclease/exonuclease/phosphatase family protein [Streptomyces sp. NPDC051677]|uniref:endonuclease/exonuclease/phosphatase family protein n=1 Tax=Streptomyces sp. NPDC051677 TaxID=3365669 RepID=UPI0037D258A2
MLAVAVLAGLLVTIATPQRASAAGVEDYRPATYNMQGGGGAGGSKWTTDIPQLINGGYNVIALQEAGPQPPASAHLVRNIGYLGNTSHWLGWRPQEYTWRPLGQAQDWYIYWVRTDFSGPAGYHGGRVNIAILTRQRATTVLVARPGDTFYGGNGLPTARPALGVNLNGTVFYSVHALSGGGNDGRQLLERMASAALLRPWAAMGDWNREPNTLQTRPGMHKYTTGRATHMGQHELDYMVSNQVIPGYGGVGRGFGSDHLAVMFRRLAANASVQLLNAHDGNRALDQDGNTIISSSQIPGRYGHWKFVAAGGGNYTIRQALRDMNPEQCMDAISTQLAHSPCNSASSQLFDINYWADTGQLAIKPANRTTCLGDDTDFGWGTEIITTMSCNKGEARFNFRFDNDPGPNAPLVVF